MNTIRRVALVTASIAATMLVFAAPARAGDDDSWSMHRDGQYVTGSGKVQTEARNVGSFRALTLRGSMKVVLRQAGKEAVQVQADDNLLPLIETQVVDRGGVATLEVGTKRGSGYRSHRDVTVTVDVVSLSALTISGSGDVVGEGLRTPALEAKISGSGDMHLKRLDVDDFSVKISGNGDLVASGRAGKASFGIAGSGDVDATGLQAEDVNIRIAGSGDANVNAHKTLTVSIAGSGDVSYAGDAVVTSSIAGSGSVNKR